jgi:hypothetical protein
MFPLVIGPNPFMVRQDSSVMVTIWEAGATFSSVPELGQATHLGSEQQLIIGCWKLLPDIMPVAAIATRS